MTRRPRLSLWQRIRRRMALLGGGYEWPDGTIEYDFEAAAGVDPFNDDSATVDRKVAAHEAKKPQRDRSWGRTIGAVILGYAIFKTLGILHFETQDMWIISTAAAYGAWVLAASAAP